MTINLNDERNIATAIDNPPIYDKMAINGIVSPIWERWFARLIETLAVYLTEYGLFIPKMTTTERATIQSPQVGQLIYNTTTDSLQIRRDNSGSPRWENIDTTP